MFVLLMEFCRPGVRPFAAVLGPQFCPFSLVSCQLRNSRERPPPSASVSHSQLLPLSETSTRVPQSPWSAYSTSSMVLPTLSFRRIISPVLLSVPVQPPTRLLTAPYCEVNAVVLAATTRN